MLGNTFKSALSEKTDLSDIGLTSMNTYETSYNVMVSYLVQNLKE